MMNKLIAFLAFFLLCAPVTADEAFWVLREEPLKESSWTAYVPAKSELAKQAVLVHAVLPGEDPVVVRHVLSEMYRQVESLKVLGRKSVPWRDGEGTLVSFSGKNGKNKIVGRAVIAPTESGTEVFMLVRHPRSDARIDKSFEEVRLSAADFLKTKTAK